MQYVVRVCVRVGHRDARLIRLQFPYHIGDAGVSDIGNILFEGKPEYEYFGLPDVHSFGEQSLDGLLGDIETHGIVDVPSGEDHVGMVADLLGLVGEVVGIDPDAVAADEPRREFQEIPLGSGGFEGFIRIYVHFVANNGQFVHQGDIQVALRVFDDLGGLGNLDGGDRINAGGNDQAVQVGDGF